MGCCESVQEPVIPPVEIISFKHSTKDEASSAEAIDTFHLVLKERPANLEAFKGRSYLGRIKPDARVCWVSFPGKFQAGWESLISDRNEDSIACVFLDDPEHGLGQHYFPDPEKPEQCLCAQIYGERDYKTFGYLMEVKQSCTDQERKTLEKRARATHAHLVFGKADADDHRFAKDLWELHEKRAAWGCDWFRVWFQRVEEAVRLGQKLKAVYFPRQVGYGKVHWDRLPYTDLWDKNGCGGSQKAEIAKLDQMKRQEELNKLDPSGAWNYEEVDVLRFLWRQFKVGDLVDFKHPESGDFCKGNILQVPELSVTGLEDPPTWQVECARTQQEMETAVVWHTTDFFDKLLNKSGHEAFKRILQDALGLKIIAVREARLPNGVLSLAVSVDMQSIQDAHRLRDRILSDVVIETLNEILSSEYQIAEELAIDKSQFFDNYARTLLTFSKLTQHQEEKLKDLFEHPDKHIHLRAPAGAGKTFVALRFLLSKLNSATGEVLYVCPSPSLIFHFIQWLLVHAHSMSQGVSFDRVLQKLLVMHSPYTQVMAVTIEDSRITLTEQSAQPAEFILAVFDEAHEVFRRDSSIFWKVSAKQKMLLSDISQSYSLHENYPEVTWQAVSLTEVVRSTKRVVLGAGAFRRQDNEKITCLGTTGPPIKTFLFQAPLDDGELLEEFAQRTLEAMRYVMQEYPSISLERHLALLVPNSRFLDKFKPKLEKCLKHNFSSSCNMIPFEDSLEYLPGVKHRDSSKEAIILDSDGNAKGLEKLIVICIGFDKAIAGSEGNFTRAQLYHALTRAQLQAVIVDRLVSGGWCEFLATLKFQGVAFAESVAAWEIRQEAAEETVAAEESTKAARKDEPTQDEVARLKKLRRQKALNSEEEVDVRPTSVFDTREVSIDVRIKKLEFDPRSLLQIRRAMISARFDGGPIEHQIRVAHRRLVDMGYEVYMVSQGIGEDFGATSLSYLKQIREYGVLLAVCTVHYGEKTASAFNTYDEVRWCLEHGVEIWALQVDDIFLPRPPFGPDHPYDKAGQAQALLALALGPAIVRLDCRNTTERELVEIIKDALDRRGSMI